MHNWVTSGYLPYELFCTNWSDLVAITTCKYLNCFPAMFVTPPFSYWFWPANPSPAILLYDPTLDLPCFWLHSPLMGFDPTLPLLCYFMTQPFHCYAIFWPNPGPACMFLTLSFNCLWPNPSLAMLLMTQPFPYLLWLSPFPAIIRWGPILTLLSTFLLLFVWTNLSPAYL